MIGDFDKYYESVEPGRRERAYAWATAIGLQDVDGLKVSKSRFFRNALVRANYTNRKLDMDKTQLHLEEFFKVLIYGDEIELHNRFLRIGQEYGTKTA